MFVAFVTVKDYAVKVFYKLSQEIKLIERVSYFPVKFSLLSKHFNQNIEVARHDVIYLK
jgi:hypothetical protein